MPKGVYIRTAWHKEINRIGQTGRQFSIKTRKKMSIGRSGPKNPFWKGGKYKKTDGYVFVLQPEHPFASSFGYVREHRLVVEKQIGRYLHRWEICHHIAKKDDNRPEKLMAFKSHSSHRRFEKKKYVSNNEIIFDGRKLKRR